MLNRARIRTLTIGVATAAVAAVAVVACGDDNGARETDVLDSGADVVANLPDAASGYDAGSEAGREPRPPFDPADEAVVCAGGAAECAVEIVAGRNHFCVRMSDGTVRCWGDDRFGAIGEAPADGGAPPAVRTIGGLTRVTQLSAAGATTCARIDDGTVSCWGSNQTGQLALSADKPSSDSLAHPVPSRVEVSASIARVEVGQRVVCAVLASGGTSCWGDNQQRQIGEPSSSTTVPTPLELGALSLTRVTMGTFTSFGLTAQGGVVSWGSLNGRMGLLGGRPASTSPDARPSPLESLRDVTSFAASATLERDEEGRIGVLVPPSPPPGGALPHAHACAIAAGEVYCWGRSDFGALCTGLLEAERLPAHAPISGKAWPQRIAVGDELSCARMTDGSIRCCGADHRGRLGIGFSALLTPVEAFTGHAVQVATSHRAVCALLQGGSVECWGSNQYGELGRGAPDQNAHPIPARVAF